MSYGGCRLASALQHGERIHIGPHDIFRSDLYPIHKDTPDADVTVDEVIIHGRLAVIMCRAGATRGAVCYDANDLVQLLERAA